MEGRAGGHRRGGGRVGVGDPNGPTLWRAEKGTRWGGGRGLGRSGGGIMTVNTVCPFGNFRKVCGFVRPRS
ncbi:hypothetical protein BRADI_3g43655v3 [Brachypodium distachyon]|uniref:Uncharacterized protein n=1 Tax=Brachypodium distachyon TaxID=15368 RepID=A0A2K2D2X2_BRADI|nr:hypothetical protein BRADI_3g43655v3 [Brachypodium distachyon]